MPLPSAPPSPLLPTPFRGKQALCAGHIPSCVSWLFLTVFSLLNMNGTTLTLVATRPHRTPLPAPSLEEEPRAGGSLSLRDPSAFQWARGRAPPPRGWGLLVFVLPSPADLAPAAEVCGASLGRRCSSSQGWCRPCLWDPEGVPLVREAPGCLPHRTNNAEYRAELWLRTTVMF